LARKGGPCHSTRHEHCAGARQPDCAGGDPVLPDPDGLHHRIAERRAANPDDKLLPPISEMADTTKRLATEPDRRSGDYVLWTDTRPACNGCCWTGNFNPGRARLRADGRTAADRGASFGTIVAVISMIPPMAVLPILFIVFGLGELSKVMLIIIGVRALPDPRHVH